MNGGMVSSLGRRVCRPLFRALMRDRATVFMLHRLSDPANGVHGHSIEFLNQTLQALRKEGAVFVPVSTILERWYAGQPGEPEWVAFTVDDGFADQAELARRAFLPMECPVTIFLISDFLDGRLWPWDDQLAYAFRLTKRPSAALQLVGQTLDIKLESQQDKRNALRVVREHCKTQSNERLYEIVRGIAAALDVELPSDPPPEHRPMSWDEARALEKLGVDFGPHSVTHRILSRLDDETSRHEINQSWMRVRQELARPVPIFAWPTGRHTDFGPREIDLATAAGLRGSMATDDDYALLDRKLPQADMYRLRRFALPNTVERTLRYASGAERGRQLIPI